jgi:hypothetical protein
LPKTTSLYILFSVGDTIAGALANIEDAARVIIESRSDQGWSLPPELLSESLKVVEAKVVVQVGGWNMGDSRASFGGWVSATSGLRVAHMSYGFDPRSS